MKKSLKAAFLYIGTAIGAGFSSGKELALFFGAASPLNVAISSIFMSLLCMLFLVAGKLKLLPKGRLIGFGIFISAGISLVSMLAGGEYVLRSLTGVPAMGLVMALAGGALVVLGIERIKLANSVLVPLIVLSIAAIFLKLDPQAYSLPFTLSRPILYSGLDVLLGGVIIADEGEKMSYKEILLTCIVICACLFGMLFMLQTVVLANGASSSMPVLAVAERFNMKAVCGALIAAAIFTTLLSSLKIVSDRVRTFLLATKRLQTLGAYKNRAFVVFFCLLVAYPISFAGFDAIVDALYPFISVCGVILTAVTLAKLVIFACTRAYDLAKRKKYANRMSKTAAEAQNGEVLVKSGKNKKAAPSSGKHGVTISPRRDNDSGRDSRRHNRRDNIRRHSRHGNIRRRTHRRRPLGSPRPSTSPRRGSACRPSRQVL